MARTYQDEMAAGMDFANEMRKVREHASHIIERFQQSGLNANLTDELVNAYKPASDLGLVATDFTNRIKRLANAIDDLCNNLVPLQANYDATIYEITTGGFTKP